MASNRETTAAWGCVEKKINEVARRILPNDFYYTSIQLNRNYAAALHTDSNNRGHSFIVGLGNYTGGSLYVKDEGVLDIHNTFVGFNGNLHYV